MRLPAFLDRAVLSPRPPHGPSGSRSARGGVPLGTPNTPIKHVVVIFDENISFDHYFGTYPYATNPPGEPQFHALPGTPPSTGSTTRC